MSRIRIGAVAYLNARPLVFGLELLSDRFLLRFDLPSRCAALLHEGSIDVGMIPSIEYLRGRSGYRIVPEVGVISNGAVASVALFTRTAVDRIRSIAADTSSRTSNGLLRVLCLERFGIDPELVPMGPNPEAMLRQCDAALVIGDPALFFDHGAAGVQKIDLGLEWSAMTGLPFVWAIWAGRPDVLLSDDVAALVEARDAGVAASDEIAAAYCGPGRTVLCQRYLRENIQYTLGAREEAGLRKYFELAEKHGVVDRIEAPAFYQMALR
jgi:chorismate dehydratase